jgi:hypothetical protein
MTTLAVNVPRTFVLGDVNEFPMIATDIIYEGAAVGMVIGTGLARPLTSVDKFVGFAEAKADNALGAASAINVRVRREGAIILPVTGAVITDINLPVYAQDDNTFSFIKTSGVFVGFSRRFVSAGYAVVEFNVAGFVDPHAGLIGATTSGTSTLAATDTGKVIFVIADADVITLPAVAMMKFRIVNGGAFGTVLVTISPNASDGIQAPGTSSVDDKDLVNTKVTACRGDFVDIEYGDATGWIVTAIKGTWAKLT